MTDIPGLPRRRLLDMIPERQVAIVGANTRTFRQHKGWSQATLGELMGWHSSSTVCAAEGYRSDWQRGFTTEEVKQLAAIFGVSPSQITTRYVNCEGQPPARFACLAYGATPSDDYPAATMDHLTIPVRHDHSRAHQ